MNRSAKVDRWAGLPNCRRLGLAATEPLLTGLHVATDLPASPVMPLTEYVRKRDFSIEVELLEPVTHGLRRDAKLAGNGRE